MSLQGCNPETKHASNRVVLYCSVDDVYAKPLVAALEKRTGLDIQALYDTEATKTAGLTNRIRSERDRPRADVFWSSALLQTLLLNEDGLLEPYISPAAADVPAQYKAKDGAWTAVGLRGRVVLAQPLTKSASSKTPLAVAGDTSLRDAVALPVGISNPQFGTASDWAAALGVRHGEAKTLALFRQFKEQNARVLGGNGDVARQVADGILMSGVTDTDDAMAQARRLKTTLSPMTTSGNQYTVLVPGSVALVKGAPNSENARKLLDAIVSSENEAALVKEMPGVFSARGASKETNWMSGGVNFSFYSQPPVDDYSKWPAAWRKLRDPLAKLFVLGTNN